MKLRTYLFLALSALFLCPVALQAIPAYPVRRTIQLQDGCTLQVTLTGDEFGHYYLSDEGLRVKELSDGTFVQLTEEQIAQQDQISAQTRNQANQRRTSRKRIEEIKPAFGVKKGLVILAEFTDQKFVISDPQKTYQDFFNKAGYTDYGMTGSVSDYFKAQSYGQFELDFDVVGPISLSKPMYYYGNNDNGDAKAMVVEACKAVNPEVNYADYDWDGNGEVDQVFIIYAGYGENYGASPNTVWPHESSVENKNLILDHTQITTYACSCELRDTEGTELDGIGAACHEFSHCLGFPDLYDTSGNGNFAMSFWDLLGSGSYNNNSCTPAAYTSYERWMAGWLTPTEITSETQITDMKPLTQSPEAYILYNDADHNEYYLLENRQLDGFDAALYGHGLLVLHVDYDSQSWSDNAVNVGNRQHMTIIPADGVCKRSIASLAGDPFPGTANNTSLTDMTSPAASLYRANTDGSYLMHKSIEFITESESGLISFLAARPDLEVPTLEVSNIGTNSFTASWTPIQDVDEYELLLTETPARASAEEACILKEDFAGAYKSTAGFSDISSKLNSYLSTSGFSGTALYQTPDLLRLGTSSTNGTLRTPVMDALQTGQLTIVMTIKPFTEGTDAGGTVNIVTNIYPKETLNFSTNTQQTFVFHPETTLDDIFRVDISAASRMYISYLALYDGLFTAEELGVVTNDANRAPMRRVQESRLTVNSINSFTFADMNPTSTYTLQVRAIQPDRVSLWSNVVNIAFPSAIQAPQSTSGNTSWYDLMGRQTALPTRPGLYIHDGKKILVK